MLEFISSFTNTFDSTFWDLLIYYVLNKNCSLKQRPWKCTVLFRNMNDKVSLMEQRMLTVPCYLLRDVKLVIHSLLLVPPSLRQPHYTHGLLHQYRRPRALFHVIGRSVVALLFIVLKHSLPLICYNLPAQRG